MAAKSPTPEERGRQFLQGILDKVAPEHRAVVEAQLFSPEVTATVGTGVLRQDEFSRGKDALAQEQARLDARAAELNEWFATNEPVVARAKAIIDAGGNGSGVVDPILDPAGAHPMDPAKLKEEITGTVNQLVRDNIIQSERNAIPFVAEVVALAQNHFQAFGEVLDTAALTQDPRVYDGKHGLRGTYDAIYGERWQARTVAARQKELDDAKELGKKEATEAFQKQLATNTANPMYPGAEVAKSPMGEALSAVQQVGADGKVAPRDFRNRVDERAAAVDYATLVHSGAGAGG